MARTTQTKRPPGELGLIEQIRRAAGRLPRTRGLTLGIGDDCAILTPPAGHDLVVTTDFSLEGRHFLRSHHPAESIGHRVLARGLSDLAAMGAKPVAAFLSLALPKSVAADHRWIDGFLRGFMKLAQATHTPLAGGDTSESPTEHVLADIVLLGAVKHGQALRRDGAKPGDAIYVTGQLGGAAAELDRLLGGKRATRSAAGHPHFYPQPRLAQGVALLGKATACMDLSDGLSTDLTHLCHASKVDAEIELAKLPVHPMAAKYGETKALAYALHGGEDYELLFTAPQRTRIPREIGGIPVTHVGMIIPRTRRWAHILTIAPDGQRSPLPPAGWEHLR